MKSTSTFCRQPIPHLFPLGILLGFLLPLASLHAQMFLAPASEGINRADLYSFEENRNGDMLAGTGNGIWRLPNGSDRWEPTGFDQTTYVIERLPSGTLLAGTDRGIYRSTDDGANWVQRYNVPGTGNFGLMANGTIIAVDLAGGSGRSFYYRSTDDGQSWENVEIRFATARRTGVVGLGEYLFSGSENGVKISYNKGSLWETTNLTEPTAALIATSNGVLVAAAGNINVQYRLYESTDTGRTWIPIDSVPSGGSAITGLAVGKSGEYYVSVEATMGKGETENWNGIWRRRPGKKSWERITPLPGVMNFTLPTPWISSGYRAMKLANDGVTWKNGSKGLRNFLAGHIEEGQDGSLYALVPERVESRRPNEPVLKHSLFRLAPDASSWEETASDLSGKVLMIDNFGNLYCLQDTLVEIPLPQGGTTEAPEYVTMVSGDGGKTWRNVRRGELVAMKADPSGTVALLLKRQNTDSWVDVLYSRDSGKTWQGLTGTGTPWESSGALTTLPAILPLADGNLLIALSEDNPVTPEDDRGIFLVGPDGPAERIVDDLIVEDFHRLSNGEPVASARLLEREPQERLRNPGIYRSSDNGMNWEIDYTGEGGGAFTDLGEGNVFSSALYSSDEGVNWTRLPQSYGKLVRTTGGDIYGFTPGLSLQHLASGGDAWENVSIIGFEGTVMSAAVAHTREDLFIGSGTHGIYHTTTASSSVRREEAHQSGAALDVRITTDRTTALVSFVLAESGPVTLALHDMLGRELRKMTDDHGKPGEYHTRLQLDGLSGGSYLIALRTEGGMTSRIISLP